MAARNQDYAQCALKAAEAVARAGEPRARTLLASCEASAGMKEQAIADYERARTDAEAARVAPAADTASRRLAELRGEPPPVAAAASGPSITLSLPPYRPSPPATPPTISPRPIPTLSMPPARAPGADGKSRPFDRYAAQQALSAVRIDGCATPAVRDAIAHLSLTFLTDGSIGAVVIQQPASLNNTDVGKCVSQKMATVRVPAFDGSPVQVGKSYAFTGAPVDSHIPIPY